MIKKLLIYTFILGLYLFPLYPVYAENTTKTTKLDERINKVEDKRLALEGKLENQREKFASRAAALKDRLTKFKDKVKAQRVDRINTELSNINKRRTDEMSRNLNRISEILTRLENRVAESTSSAASTDAVQGSITTAKTQITLAKEIVASQSAKDYTIQVSSESAVKADATKQRDLLHTDLKSTQAVVKQARTAVSAAIKAFGQALGGQK